MRKHVSLLLAVFVLLSFAGCSVSVSDVSSLPESSISSETDENPYGITLTAKAVAPSGMTLVCTQSGGQAKGSLQTGSFFCPEQYTDGAWMPVKPIIPEDEIGWDMMALVIYTEDITEWEINWSYLYGELSPGNYRIGKQIMDFIETGDYETQIYYAEFAIE